MTFDEIVCLRPLLTASIRTLVEMVFVTTFDVVLKAVFGVSFERLRDGPSAKLAYCLVLELVFDFLYVIHAAQFFWFRRR